MNSPSTRPLLLVVAESKNSCTALWETLPDTARVITCASPETVLTSSCGEGAQPDLIIFSPDVAAQKVLDICARCKTDPLTRAVQLLVLVAADNSYLALEAMESGADDFIVMPVDRSLLRARIRKLLRVKERFDELTSDIWRLTQVGIALSAEHDLARLLERIVDEARALNHADAGTLYLVDHDAGLLRFQVMQNGTLGTRISSRDGTGVSLPAVPLVASNVSAYVALTGEVVNIADVYQAVGFDFSGPRTYDSLSGYRSVSMLVVPLINSDRDVIGVLQLINAREPDSGRIIPFHAATIERTKALASQAGIALTNARLINDQQELLEGLIQVTAIAVDEKSPYTAGHVQRVTRLAVRLAESVNQERQSKGSSERFSADDLDAIRIAGLLHDIGKIVVPEHVVDKATKLERVYDRIHEIRSRFSIIRRGKETEILRKKIRLLQASGPHEVLEMLDSTLRSEIVQLEDDFAFIESINYGSERMAPEDARRLERIASRTYVDDRGDRQPYLTPDEARNLCIPRGTLLPEEIDMIRNHVSVSIRLLSEIPFSRKLRDVPTIVADHHEALDGSGYPNGKRAAELPMASRILAIADIFDALTAPDRPYKKGYPLDVAYRILREEADRGRLDRHLVELFIRDDCFGSLVSGRERRQETPLFEMSAPDSGAFSGQPL